MYTPLAGIKVADFTLAAAGPSCTKQLAELGADVIWIEPIKGASTRAHHKYDFYCAGKRSLPLDLKSPDGMEVMLRLIDRADIFITNYRLRAVGKLGLDYESLQKRNPGLIYAAITGFGTEGEEANNPGTDTAAFWAKGGLLRDYAEQGTLVVAPSAFGDCATGMALAGGVLAALYDREKTGRGCDLYTSLLGMAVYLNHHAVVEVQYGEEYPKSRTAPSYALLNSYRCKDGGWISITVPKADFSKYFDTLMTAVGRGDLAGNPGFSTVASACGESSAALTAILDEAFAALTTPEAIAALRAINVVVDRVQSTKDVLSDPQVAANKLLYPLEATRPPEGGREIMVPASPIKYRKDLDFGIAGQTRGPKLGEHTAEILAECGYSQEQIDALLKARVTAGA